LPAPCPPRLQPPTRPCPNSPTSPSVGCPHSDAHEQAASPQTRASLWRAPDTHVAQSGTVHAGRPPRHRMGDKEHGVSPNVVAGGVSYGRRHFRCPTRSRPASDTRRGGRRDARLDSSRAARNRGRSGRDRPGTSRCLRSVALLARHLLNHLSAYAHAPAIAVERGADDTHVPADGVFRPKEALMTAFPDAGPSPTGPCRFR
jgi:hypothetical protein